MIVLDSISQDRLHRYFEELYEKGFSDGEQSMVGKKARARENGNTINDLTFITTPLKPIKR